MTVREVRIREFRMADLDAARRLWAEAGLTLRAADHPHRIAQKLQRDPGLSLVAESDGGLVATLLGGWDGRRGWLYHLAVAPAVRRRGIARMLLDEMERRMRSQGVVEVFGLVMPGNEASLRLFAAHGYETPPLAVVGKRLAA